MERNRKRFIAPMFMFVVTAFMIARSPRIAEFHAVDVLLIFACGMCFGSALAMIVKNLRDA